MSSFDQQFIYIISAGFAAAAVGVTLGLINGGRIRIGKFEIKRGKDILDEQIDEIATIVKEQNQNQENKGSVSKAMTLVVKNLSDAVASIGSPLAYSELIDSLARLTQALKEKKEDPTWSLVEGLINSYHKQALRQASIQFWFSVIAAVVGFGFVINEIAFNPASSASERAIGAIPGIVIDLVAALFFKQAEQTRQRATELYDRLRTDNERTVAIELIDSIENENLRSIVKAQLALKIGGVTSTISDLSTLTQNEAKATTKP